MAVTGLLLAAGAGRRMGGPKGLLRDPDGTPWAARVVQTLRSGGCSQVSVVVGAAADQVRALLPDDVEVVLAEDWAQGMGASLREGLDALMADGSGAPDAVLVTLVDLPGVTAEVVARLVAHTAPSVLARAGYGGVPGHPVLITGPGSAPWRMPTPVPGRTWPPAPRTSSWWSAATSAAATTWTPPPTCTEPLRRHTRPRLSLEP